MRQIRAYLLFTGWRYKLVMFLGLPGAVLAGGWLWRSFTVVSSDGGGPGFYLFSHLSGSEGFRILTAMLLIFTEILSDQAVFNGIQSKRGYKLDFLKTSPRGREILWQGLTGDLVRRMLTAAACACAVWVTKVLTLDGGLARGLGLVLAVFSLETLGLFISRFTRSILLCLYTAYGCAAAGVILLILVSELPVSWLWAAGIDGFRSERVGGGDRYEKMA